MATHRIEEAEEFANCHVALAACTPVREPAAVSSGTTGDDPTLDDHRSRSRVLLSDDPGSVVRLS
jgi:hypothetical protein